MNICSKTNNYAIKVNMNYFLLFSKALRDIGNIIAASDRPNETL